jgi:hypothetical protein
MLYDSYIRSTFLTKKKKCFVKIKFSSIPKIFFSVLNSYNIPDKMTDQRFKYYTGYEVDNEPSEDEDDLPCNTVITDGNVNSDR